MKFYIKAIIKGNDGKEYHPAGSSHTWLMDDLKTVRGVVARINHSPMPKLKGIVRIEIYTYSNLYDERTFHLIKTLKF